MDFEFFSVPSVLLLSFTALILLLSNDWRVIISALGLMYLGVFTLVLFSWPLEMAVVKLVAGWISTSVLGISMINISTRQHRNLHFIPSEIIFRISAAGLVGLVTISLSTSIQTWLMSYSYEQVIGGLVLIGMGLLHLGFTSQPLHIAVGLLTFLAGFEILYATAESSVLVSGFLAVINMGVALAGAYLLISASMEVDE